MDLSEIKALLSHPEHAQAMQGLELLYTLDEVSLWQALAADWGLQSRHTSEQATDLYWAAQRGGSTWPGAHAAEVAAHILLNAGHLTHNRELVLSRTSVRSLAPFQRLTQLETLNLSFCRQLTDIAPVAEMRNLERLFMAGCARVTSIAPLAGLPKLRHIDLGRCTGIGSLAPLAGAEQMWRLTLSDMGETPLDLAPLRGMTRLSSLDLSKWRVLEDLRSVGHLSWLKELDLSRCARLSDVSGLVGLLRVRRLMLDHTAIESAAPLRRLPALEHLNVTGCAALQDLGPPSDLPKLERLLASECASLRDISGLAAAPRLKVLHLSGCAALEDFSVLSELPCLETLTLEGCLHLPSEHQRQLKTREEVAAFQDALRSAQRQRRRARLASADLDEVRAELAAAASDPLAATPYDVDWGRLRGPGPHGAVAALALLGRAGRLGSTDRLTVTGLDTTAPLRELPPLPQLKRLTLIGADLRDLAELPLLAHVEHLSLQHCAVLPDLSPLAGLRALSLSKVGEVSLDALPLPPGLRTLQIVQSTVRGGLAPLSALPLELLQLQRCPEVTDLSPLSSSETLRDLRLEGSRLAALALPPRLEKLYITDDPVLSDIGPLAERPGLTTLGLRACPQITDVAPLLPLTALEATDLRGNPQLPEPLRAVYLGRSDLAALRADPRGLSWIPEINRIWTALEAEDLSVLDALPADSPLWAMLATELEPLPDRGKVDTDIELSTQAVLRIARQAGMLDGFTHLDLEGTSITSLDALAGLPLRRLGLQRCEALTDISAVATLTSLERLEMGGCKGLPRALQVTFSSRLEIAPLQITLREPA